MNRLSIRDRRVQSERGDDRVADSSFRARIGKAKAQGQILVEAAAMRSHSMRVVSMFALVIILLSTFPAGAQEKQPVKGPVFPPINPAVARLSQIITRLDGAGVAIASGDEMDLLVGACGIGPRAKPGNSSSATRIG